MASPLAFDSPGVSYRVRHTESTKIIEMIYNNAVCGSFMMPYKDARQVAKEILSVSFWPLENDSWKETELWGGDFDEKQDAELERKHNQ